MNTFFTYRCDEQISLTTDICLLKCRPVSKPLAYQAGQYVEIQLLNGATLPLSIANAPRNDGDLEFHLRHNQNQPMAQQLLKDISKTSTLTLRGPFGKSILKRAEPSQKLVFLAGGTGFAPLKALLEEAFAENRNTAMDLYWGISCPIDAYDTQLVQKWQGLFPNFRFTMVLSSTDKFPLWAGPTGLIPEFCAAIHPNFDNTCVFASGPYDMIKAAQPLLIKKGLRTSHFITDMSIDTKQEWDDEKNLVHADYPVEVQ